MNLWRLFALSRFTSVNIPVQKESRGLLLQRLRAGARGGQVCESFLGAADPMAQFLQTPAAVHGRFWNSNGAPNFELSQGGGQRGLFGIGIANVICLLGAFEDNAVGIEHVARSERLRLALWNVNRLAFRESGLNPFGRGRSFFAIRK